MLLNPFKGKNILITGGSRGIGLDMAREFARNGANLALISQVLSGFSGIADFSEIVTA